MDKQLTLKWLRYSFMAFSIFIIASGLTLFIIGNVHFETRWIQSFGFLGGHMVSIALFVMVYGALGFYSAYKRDRFALIIFIAIAVVHFVSRVILWIEAAAHGYDKYYNNETGWYYGGVGIEWLVILWSTALLYFI